MIRGVVAATVLVAAGLFFTPASALAERSRRGGGVIRLEEITIEGRVQKPNAFYVLQRSSLGFEQRESQDSFVEEVVRSVDQEPF